jgi:hypothetical protein
VLAPSNTAPPSAGGDIGAGTGATDFLAVLLAIGIEINPGSTAQGGSQGTGGGDQLVSDESERAKLQELQAARLPDPRLTQPAPAAPVLRLGFGLPAPVDTTDGATASGKLALAISDGSAPGSNATGVLAQNDSGGTPDPATAGPASQAQVGTQQASCTAPPPASDPAPGAQTANAGDPPLSAPPAVAMNVPVAEGPAAAALPATAETEAPSDGPSARKALGDKPLRRDRDPVDGGAAALSGSVVPVSLPLPTATQAPLPSADQQGGEPAAKTSTGNPSPTDLGAGPQTDRNPAGDWSLVGPSPNRNPDQPTDSPAGNKDPQAPDASATNGQPDGSNLAALNAPEGALPPGMEISMSNFRGRGAPSQELAFSLRLTPSKEQPQETTAPTGPTADSTTKQTQITTQMFQTPGPSTLSGQPATAPKTANSPSDGHSHLASQAQPPASDSVAAAGASTQSGNDSKKPDDSNHQEKRQSTDAQPKDSAPDTVAQTPALHEPAPVMPVERPSAANNIHAAERLAEVTATPSAARATELESRPNSAKTAPLKEITVTLPGNSEKPLDLRIVDERGKLHVEVRTSDTQLASSLRDNVGDLVDKLDHAGYRTESLAAHEDIRPAEAATGGNNAGGNGARNQSADQDSTGGQGGGQSGQQHQQGQGRGNRPRWLEEIVRNFHAGVQEQESEQS